MTDFHRLTSLDDRRKKVDELCELRDRVTREIVAIEQEIDKEIEAWRRARKAAKAANVRVGRPPAAECGTDGGYYRHRRTLKEPACEACKLAHRVAERAQKARRAERQQEAS